MATKIEKTVWVAEDGRVFEDETAALEYEQFYEILCKMETSDIYWGDTSPEEVLKWLLEHYDLTPKQRSS